MTSALAGQAGGCWRNWSRQFSNKRTEASISRPSSAVRPTSCLFKWSLAMVFAIDATCTGKINQTAEAP
jgi:hypothetical protein